MNYPISQTYDQQFLQENMMGPNAMKLLEELTARISLPESGLVLDLGCGAGLTSIYLVEKLGYQVIAADLWVAPSDNYRRFCDFGLTPNQILPIRVEAHALPFAEASFDLVVSIDAYQYFGCDESYLPKHLLPLVKPGGLLLISVPGVKEELGPTMPPSMALSWTREDVDTFHSLQWWHELLADVEGMEILFVEEMVSFNDVWEDWLECGNEHAMGDRPALEGGAGELMNFVAIGLRKLE